MICLFGVALLSYAAARSRRTDAGHTAFIFTLEKANDNGEEPHFGVGKSVFLDGEAESLSDEMYP